MNARPEVDPDLTASLPTTVFEPPSAISDSQRRRALSSSQVGTWHRDLAVGIARVDASWCASVDIDPCEGADHLARWARRIHPDDVARFAQASEQLTASDTERRDFEAEYRILTRASQWLWILQRGRVTRTDSTGQPVEAAGICIDIDARKRAEVEAHENESRLATALWGAQAAFWQWHIPSDSAVRSPLWFAMTGYTAETWEDRPQPWTSRVHPDDLPRVSELIDAHLEGRTQSLELSYRIACADGAWKWILDRGRVVEWDFDGHPTAALGVSMDIDAQKQAELQLRSSEARLETAIWGAGVGLYELDCKRGVTRWLNDWCTRFDIDPCAGDGHVDRWDSNIHPEDLTVARARFSGHLAGTEEYYDAEYRIRTRSGAWRWLFERGRVVEHDEQGEPLRLVGTCMDIHERKTAELQVEESKRRLQMALEGARGCLWEFDVERQQYNDAYYELLGVDPREGRLQENFWTQRAHPDDVDRVLDAERELLAGRLHRLSLEYRIRHADGSWRWMVDRFRGADRDDQGVARLMIGFTVDITDEVEVREALRASENVLRLVAENSSDWLMLFDCDLVCTFSNRGLRGRSAADLVGHVMGDLLPEKYRTSAVAAAREVIETGRPRKFEQRVEAPNRAARFLDVHYRRARHGPVVTGLVLTAADVTDRVQQQQALSTQAQIMQTMSEAVLLIDVDYVVRLANPAFDAMACAAVGSLVGTRIDALLAQNVTDHIEFGPRIREEWAREEGQTVVTREFDWRRPDGVVRRMIGNFMPLLIGGEELILAVYFDISRQRGLERELLDVANREQQRIGSDLHDGLGQELTGIAMMLRGMTSAARAGRPPTHDALEELTQLVQSTIQTTRGLVRGIAPARVQEGGLAGALNALAEQLTAQSGVAVTFRNEWPVTRAIADQPATHLYRLAQEAVTNALRHGEPTAVTMTLRAAQKSLILEVVDDGRGFPERSNPETGFGLRTMRSRAKVLGGELVLVSSTSTGVSIRCVVPVDF